MIIISHNIALYSLYISYNYAAHTEKTKKQCSAPSSVLFIVLTTHRIASIVDSMRVCVPSKGVDLTAGKPAVTGAAGGRKTTKAARRLALAHGHIARLAKPALHWPHLHAGQTMTDCIGIKPEGIRPHHDTNGPPTTRRRRTCNRCACGPYRLNPRQWWNAPQTNSPSGTREQIPRFAQHPPVNATGGHPKAVPHPIRQAHEQTSTS